MNINDFKSNDPITWCPGCGELGILVALKKALVKIGKAPKDILLVSGIGQAAKLPHYITCNCFNGLHGRALPVAAGVLVVIVPILLANAVPPLYRSRRTLPLTFPGVQVMSRMVSRGQDSPPFGAVSEKVPLPPPLMVKAPLSA